MSVRPAPDGLDEDMRFSVFYMYIRRTLHLHQQASAVSLKKGAKRLISAKTITSVLSTAGKMKKLILVAAILQLEIIIISAIPAAAPKKYEFGDILVFPRKCSGNNAKPVYNHYAVYVGPQSEVDVGQGDNDLVHRIRVGKPSCQFGQLANVKEKWEEKVYNYLDGVDNGEGGRYTPGTTEEIKARIADLLDKCKKYKLFKNNCEHFATEVRYNIAMTMQVGAKSECVVVKSKKAKELLDRIKKDLDEEVRCVKSS